MKTSLSICWALLILAIASLSLAADAQEKSDGVIAHCFDGDTFKLRDRRVVRLAGIDSPELPKQGNPAQFYSHASRNALEGLARGHKITMTFPGLSTRDRYGRLIAEALLEDGRSLNEALVDQGAAWFYPHQDLSPEIQERLRLLQADAINGRRGMWEKVLELPFASKPYIGNRASLRFFPVDCPQAQGIKPRNRVNFGNLMDAFLAGYAPARVCPFWPSE